MEVSTDQKNGNQSGTDYKKSKKYETGILI
jgi:hypothetical protein